MKGLVGNVIDVRSYSELLCVPVVTNLRAIAGFVTVIDASVPIEAPNEGSPYNSLPKEQIGEDTDYGVGGPVRSADD